MLEYNFTDWLRIRINNFASFSIFNFRPVDSNANRLVQKPKVPIISASKYLIQKINQVGQRPKAVVDGRYLDIGLAGSHSSRFQRYPLLPFSLCSFGTPFLWQRKRRAWNRWHVKWFSYYADKTFKVQSS